jgi:hypothetical protein
MSDEDPFADLLGPLHPGTVVNEQPPPMRPSPKKSEQGAAQNGAESPKLRNDTSSVAPAPVPLPANMYVMLKEDAKDYVHEAVATSVEKAVTGAVGKLVSGMREVLRSVVQRVESLEDKVDMLKSTLEKVDLESNQATLHSRFTKVDEGLRDIGRTVQAMRDHSELIEAQQQLARLQTESGGKKKKSQKVKCEPPSPTGSSSPEAQAATPKAEELPATQPCAQPPSAVSAAPRAPPPAAVPAAPPAPPPQPPAPAPTSSHPPPPANHYPTYEAPPAPPAAPTQPAHAAPRQPQHAPPPQPPQYSVPASSAPPPPPHYAQQLPLPPQQTMSAYPGPPPPAQYPDMQRQVAHTGTAAPAYSPYNVPMPPPPNSNFTYPQQPPPPPEPTRQYSMERPGARTCALASPVSG